MYLCIGNLTFVSDNSYTEMKLFKNIIQLQQIIENKMYVHNMNTFTEVFKDLTRYTHKDLKFCWTLKIIMQDAQTSIGLLKY